MLSKHFILSVCLHIIVTLRCSYCQTDIENSPANLTAVKDNVVKIADSILQVTPFFNITITSAPQNCVQMICKFVCFNGRASEIARDVDTAMSNSNVTCEVIEELRIYNYVFTDNKLSYGFLGPYSDKVRILYLASSNITDVDAGTFANGVYEQIYFENLKLTHLKKDFFHGITKQFQGLSVVQRQNPVKTVNDDFLDHVKYQIKSLTMQVGLSCVRNLTGSQNLLNNLAYVDLSYNDLGQNLVNTVFSKLSMVEHMDISHSHLEFLPSYIFSDCISMLEYLDLSHNNLKTISRLIFGWREIPRDLKIYAHDNDWECTCDLQMEMKEIILYQNSKVICSQPQDYANWSVFDERICGDYYAVQGTTVAKGVEVETSTQYSAENGGGAAYPQTTVFDFWTVPYAKKTTESIISSTYSTAYTVPSFTTRPDLVEFSCHTETTSQEFLRQSIKWPGMDFSVVNYEQLRVKVIIAMTLDDSPASPAQRSLNDTYGLIWFNKATTEYYKMEINYKEYGLGCYNEISYETTVDDLTPNVAYTFCMVIKDQLTVSPFSCKSVHVGGNLNIQYSSVWLTRDMKVTGLSLVIFGIVMFSFAGILLIYMLLKHKPILLKGSKRVTTPGNSNSDDIVVMPRAKSVKSIKEKEDKLAKSGPIFYTEKRRMSSDSTASYESYINANLYECIPAYTKVQTAPPNAATPSTASSRVSIISSQHNMASETMEQDYNYVTPLNTVSSTADLVNYAEIPYRSKRVSNDPLPAVPIDQKLHDRKLFNANEYGDIGVIYVLDSQV